jgi:hypothetical protein
VLKIETCLGEISMIPLSSITSSVSLGLLNYPLKEEVTHGVTCRAPLFWSKWIGFLLLWPGPISILTPWFFLLLGSLLITYLVKFR